MPPPIWHSVKHSNDPCDCFFLTPTSSHFITLSKMLWGRVVLFQLCDSKKAQTRRGGGGEQAESLKLLPPPSSLTALPELFSKRPSCLRGGRTARWLKVRLLKFKCQLSISWPCHPGQVTSSCLNVPIDCRAVVTIKGMRIGNAFRTVPGAQ